MARNHPKDPKWGTFAEAIKLVPKAFKRVSDRDALRSSIAGWRNNLTEKQKYLALVLRTGNIRTNAPGIILADLQAFHGRKTPVEATIPQQCWSNPWDVALLANGWAANNNFVVSQADLKAFFDETEDAGNKTKVTAPAHRPTKVHNAEAALKALRKEGVISAGEPRKVVLAKVNEKLVSQGSQPIAMPTLARLLSAERNRSGKTSK